MKIVDHDFHKLVKIRLIELEMTQVELAKALGTSKQYLHLILTGERSGEKYIEKIKEILKINEAA